MGLSSATLLALPQLPGGVPKGYLRVLSFTEDSVLVDQRTVQLSAAALGHYETLDTGPLVVQHNGYVSVYVGNESAADVYFDDLTVEHRQGLQVQENSYDPWGASLVGLDYTSPGTSLVNHYQFNGKERQDDFNLGWQDYGARMYDSQLGRWLCVDPLANAMRRHSPYNYCFDNPLRFVDPDGMGPETVHPLGKNAQAAYTAYVANANAHKDTKEGQEALAIIKSLEGSSVTYNINAGEITSGKNATVFTPQDAQIIEHGPAAASRGGSTDFNWEDNSVTISIKPDGELTQSFLGDELATANQFQTGQFGFYVEGADGDNTNNGGSYGYTKEMEVQTKFAGVGALKNAGLLPDGVVPSQLTRNPKSNYSSLEIMDGITRTGQASPQQVQNLVNSSGYSDILTSPVMTPPAGSNTASMQNGQLNIQTQ